MVGLKTARVVVRARSAGKGAHVCIGVLVAALSGCGVPKSHDHIESNLDRVMSGYSGRLGKTAGTSQESNKLPWVAAKFCLERAKDNAQGSHRNTNWDVAMLIAAAATGGVGTASYAASTGIENDDRQRTWAQVGSINIAVTASLLGLRAALNLGEIAREQRSVSADQVEAAVGIIELLALQPDEWEKNPFADCTEGERKIAQLIAREKAAEAIKSSIEEAKKAADAAQKKKEEAKNVEDSASEKMKAAAGSSLEQAQLNKTIADARVEQAEANVEIAKGGVAEARQGVVAAAAGLRRAILYFTEGEVQLAIADLDTARQDVVEAKKQVSAAQGELGKAREDAAQANKLLTVQ